MERIKPFQTVQPLDLLSLCNNNRRGDTLIFIARPLVIWFISRPRVHPAINPMRCVIRHIKTAVTLRYTKVIVPKCTVYCRASRGEVCAPWHAWNVIVVSHALRVPSNHVPGGPLMLNPMLARRRAKPKLLALFIYVATPTRNPRRKNSIVSLIAHQSLPRNIDLDSLIFW